MGTKGKLQKAEKDLQTTKDELKASQDEVKVLRRKVSAFERVMAGIGAGVAFCAAFCLFFCAAPIVAAVIAAPKIAMAVVATVVAFCVGLYIMSPWFRKLVHMLWEGLKFLAWMIWEFGFGGLLIVILSLFWAVMLLRAWSGCHVLEFAVVSVLCVVSMAFIAWKCDIGERWRFEEEEKKEVASEVRVGSDTSVASTPASAQVTPGPP
eukprot:GFYU01005030.1.p1 GENE.GFYU01005030.1~~GFYU01005030.1.p1  ORF type:complete len:208 (-),score=64.26 GFYU01005030.1:949-1572(-)